MDPKLASELDAVDLAYYQGLLAALSSAQAAVQVFAQFLASKYGLAQGDGIQMDGHVIRASQDGAQRAADGPLLTVAE